MPTIIEADIPNTSTGPATVNIFPPTPIIYPSDLYSIEGATIEFGADGPMRPPYVAYMQGGINYAHVKIAITKAVLETFYK